MTAERPAAAVYRVEVEEKPTNRFSSFLQAIWSTTVLASNEPVRECLVKVIRSADGPVVTAYLHRLKSEANAHAQSLNERLQTMSESEFEDIWKSDNDDVGSD